MRQNPTGFFFGLFGVILTFLSLGLTTLFTTRVDLSLQSTKSLVAAIRACETLLDGSDTLTRAVRAYAATGDERYRLQFDEELLRTKSRDKALEQLRRLGLTQNEIWQFQLAKRYSDELVTLEHQIFAAAATMNLGGALKLAYGKEYLEAKASIVDTTRIAQGELEARLTAEGIAQANAADRLRLTLIAVYTVNLIILIAGISWFVQRRVMDPVVTSVAKVRKILNGDHSEDLPSHEVQTGNLAKALEDLRLAAEAEERKRWVETGLKGIIAETQATNNLADFTEMLLKQLASVLHASHGAMYYLDDQVKNLAFLGGFGHDQENACPLPSLWTTLLLDPEHMGPKLDAAEAALPLICSEEQAPDLVLIFIPIVIDRRVVAMIELTCSQALQDLQQRFLSKVQEMIAPPLEIVLRAWRAQQLLEATQIQSLELEKKTEALQVANKQLSAIFQAATSGISLVKDHHVVSCNRMMEEIFGYQPGEMIGGPSRRWYFDEVDYQTAVTAFDAFMVSDIPFHFDSRLVRKDGSTFLGRMSPRPLDMAAPSSGLVVMVDDVTVERETAAQLLQAVAAAEEASLAKSAFLANMSHEIRTPMNAVLGFTQLLQRDSTLEERHQNHVATISRSGYHLLDLINDILEMSKLDAGRSAVEATDFDFHQLLADVVTMFRVKMEDKGLHFTLELQEGLPEHLRSDPTKIMQVLINVLGNALKFSEQGEVKVKVRSASDHQGDLVVVIEVTDTGIGIPNKDLAKIFDAFEQAEAGLKKGGTGLGMAISRKHAHLLGGDLTVSSREGEGSTFFFHFRPTRAEGTLSLPKVTRCDIIGLAPDSYVPHLLLVEDIAVNRELVRVLLEPFGFQVTEAVNGQECLDRLATIRPDLILMDWVMPVMNGLEATQRIRANDAWQDIPIVVVTARSVDEVAGMVKGCEVAGYLRKPILLLDLLLQIQALVPNVRMEYADLLQSSKGSAPLGATKDRKDAAVRLPEPLRLHLAGLVENGEIDRFSEIVLREVQPLEADLADHLQLLTGQFDYRQILLVLG